MADLTRKQAEALPLIIHGEDRARELTAWDLADYLDTTVQGAQKVLKGLLNKGLVREREVGRTFGPTDAGREAATHA